MYLIGVVVMGLFGFLYFGMVDTAIPVLVFIAITVSLFRTICSTARRRR